MTLDLAVLLPATAMVLLTFIVWLKMYSDRLNEMRLRRIHPQQLSSAREVAHTLQNTNASDHLKNLFELPVLFYALCAFLAITKLTTLFLLAGAWGYVALRAYHAWIHLTHNKVIRRFQAYVASTLLLFVMWGVFAVKLLTLQQ
jgi:hypothetical protein